MPVTTIPRNFFALRTIPAFNLKLDFAADRQDSVNRIRLLEPLSSLSDNELVLRTRQDNKAFSAIIHRYQDALLRYIVLSRRSAVSANNLLQEILVQMYVYLNDYDESISFSSWVYRIAHKELVKNQQTSALDVARDGCTSPYEEMINGITGALPDCEHYRSQQMVSAIKELKGSRYDIMVLKYSEGRSLEEISDILQLKRDQVQAQSVIAEGEIMTCLAKNSLLITDYE